MKKIIFIEPHPPDLNVFTKMRLPRLGTILLCTILKEKGYKTKTYVEAVKELDLKDVLTADAVGISCITSTSKRSYEIAKLIKSAGIPVFMGGPHVTFLPDEGLEACDYIVRGEADEHIVEFVEALFSGKGLEKIPGLSYKKDGIIHHNKNVSFCKDLDMLPTPDFTLVHGLEKKAAKGLSITPIMTSRGCPFDCSFCSVTSMFGQKYRFRSTEKVIEELRINKACGSDWVFFYDDNFCAHKKHTKELLTAMIKNDLTPNWTAQVRADVAKDPELLDLMRRSGCHTVYIGFESVNPATLELYNKKQSVEDIEDCITILHKNKIRIHGMFVFGSDLDTVDTIHKTLTFAKKNDIETVQFLILTPLPGTKCYRDLDEQKRIISKDWSIYDAHHVVFEPKMMTYYELQAETIKAVKSFYSIPQILKRAARFDFFNVAVKSYGHNIIRQWEKKNKYFIDYTKSITEAGKAFEVAAKKTAEDIQEKFRELQLANATGAPAPNKTR